MDISFTLGVRLGGVDEAPIRQVLKIQGSNGLYWLGVGDASLCDLYPPCKDQKASGPNL